MCGVFCLQTRSLFLEPLSLESLMAEVETGNLNHDEIQKLVDVLLDKQKSAEQWKKVDLPLSIYLEIFYGPKKQVKHQNIEECYYIY